jgi:hypothetical protein
MPRLPRKSKAKTRVVKEEAEVEASEAVEVEETEEKTVEEENKEEKEENKEKEEKEKKTRVRKPRVAPTKDSVLENLSTLVESIDKEVQNLKDSTTKSKGIRFLRSVGKQLKTLRTQFQKVMKKKRPTTEQNKNTGLNKPIRISHELSKFFGWPLGELHSRSEVTRLMARYIKDNNLFDPQYGRTLWLHKDPKTTKLLRIKNGLPLYTYATLQIVLSIHFPKGNNPEPSSDVDACQLIEDSMRRKRKNAPKKETAVVVEETGEDTGEDTGENEEATGENEEATGENEEATGEAVEEEVQPPAKETKKVKKAKVAKKQPAKTTKKVKKAKGT